MQKNVWTRAKDCSGCATCVEVLDTGKKIWVRDSKSTSILSFTYEEWSAFISGLRDGDFELEGQ
jgi:Fe-S-cluster-containing hydrogenase component 2